MDCIRFIIFQDYFDGFSYVFERLLNTNEYLIIIIMLIVCAISVYQGNTSKNYKFVCLQIIIRIPRTNSKGNDKCSKESLVTNGKQQQL